MIANLALAAVLSSVLPSTAPHPSCRCPLPSVSSYPPARASSGTGQGKPPLPPSGATLRVDAGGSLYSPQLWQIEEHDRLPAYDWDPYQGNPKAKL